MQTSRATIASYISADTTREFDLALHEAIPNSIKTMTELHRAVCECVRALKAAGLGPVPMILAMKACAFDSAARYGLERDEYPATPLNLLSDQIIKWSIAEYYRTVS